MKIYKGYLMLSIAISIMILIEFFPLVKGINLSFTDRNLLYPSTTYIGLSNYFEMFKSDDFWNAFFHSSILVSVVVALEYFFGVLLALSLKQEIPGIKILRSVVMITWVIPVVATVIMWQFMSEPSYGFI